MHFVGNPRQDLAKGRVDDEGTTSYSNLRSCDIQSFDFPNESFDVVFAANSVQYAEDPLAALGEFKRGWKYCVSNK
ncbi:class I SAM-dependent methyltransferase [Paraglaciecola sp. MB-3u-78]|uniref:class I SAM-dependent methyltransferase n=1 Tax=Paraglaciecola sp. MB-3u-78 TaxID=2058332 RepID=UPI000C344E9A|nr:hypothetical protein CXF95_13120 [Paraglaciecola sp. MB-3u-78]